MHYPKMAGSTRTPTLLAWTAPAARAADAVLTVYHRSDYIAKDTVPTFERPGIHVPYDSNATFQAKLFTGTSGYGIVAPTSKYMAT